MNLGLRYHLASLIAVFFSLILGILIGAALFQDSALVEEQGLIILEMEGVFNELIEKQRDLQISLQLQDRALDALKTSILTNSLEGKTIYLLPEQKDLNQKLEKSLAVTGAKFLTYEPEMELSSDAFFIAILEKAPFSEQSLDLFTDLSNREYPLAFVWQSQAGVDHRKLPSSLMVDNVETRLGEIALVLGLLKGSKGLYGLNKDALGLLP